MNESELKAYILRRLGEGRICVELTPQQVADSVDDAKLWLMLHMGGTLKQDTLTLTAGSNEYDAASDCESVVDVIFQKDANDFFDSFDFDGTTFTTWDFWYGPSAGGQGYYSRLLQSYQYVEMAQRMLSSDNEWKWNKASRKLLIYPNSVGTTVRYLYLSNDVDMSTISRRELYFLKEYSFAAAMEILGYIRTKYSEVPSASGSISLNGDTLLTNAETLKMNLEDKVKEHKRPLGFIVG